MKAAILFVNMQSEEIKKVLQECEDAIRKSIAYANKNLDGSAIIELQAYTAQTETKCGKARAYHIELKAVIEP